MGNQSRLLFIFLTNLLFVLYNGWRTTAWTVFSFNRISVRNVLCRHSSLDDQESSNTNAIRSMVVAAIVESGTSIADIRSIVFKPGKLVVTIEGSSAFVSAPQEEVEADDGENLIIEDDSLLDSDTQIEEYNFLNDSILDGMDEDTYEDTETSDFESMDTLSNEGDVEGDDARSPAKNDITAIARAINSALEIGGVGSLGYEFATRNEIEVTTPGASNILTGVMFQSYRGFDVKVFMLNDSDQKVASKRKQSSTVLEGKLIEKTKDHVVLNQKGRIKKINIEKVDYVTLPRSKSE